MKVEIRPHKVSDAKRLFEIVSDTKYIKYVERMGGVKRVKTLEDEIQFLKKAKKDLKKGFTIGYTIVVDGRVQGAIALMINQHRKFITEVGYLLSSEMWGKGITTEALKMMSQSAFAKYNIKRIELVVHPNNKASIRVAEKAGYKKEGKMRNGILTGEGKSIDSIMYSLIP
jgi:ribosomal-protein-alanine N-acetyltransferase